MPFLFNETAAVDIAELRENCKRIATSDQSNRHAPLVGLGIGRQGKCQERMLVVFLQHDNRPGKVAVLTIGLVSHIDADMHPPNITLVEIEGGLLRVDAFLLGVPPVEVLAHTKRLSLAARWAELGIAELRKVRGVALSDEVAFECLASAAIRAEVAMAVAGQGRKGRHLAQEHVAAWATILVFLRHAEHCIMQPPRPVTNVRDDELCASGVGAAHSRTISCFGESNGDVT